MAYDGFDNINLLAAQAAIEAEMNIFENSSSGHTYTTMQGFTFQPNILQQQQQSTLASQQQFVIICVICDYIRHELHNFLSENELGNNKATLYLYSAPCHLAAR